MAGVDSTGFTPKTITEIITALQTGYRQVYGASVNVAARSRIGQRIALFAGALAEVWELGQALFVGLDPTAATGASLDNQLKLIGLSRKGTIFSNVLLTLTGADGTIVPGGKIASVNGTAERYATVTNALLVLLANWAQSTSYGLGQFRTANGNVYVTITAGLSASSGTGPSGTGADITDGTCHWAYVGPGVAMQQVNATATVTGPLPAFARSVDTIETPVSGWQGVLNLLDADTVGRNIETDPEARARRDLSYSGQARSPLDAIRTAILAVPGVTTCTVFENYTDATVDGMPAKSFECLVEGGADQDIINAIFATRPGGIQPYGNTSGSATDSQGGSHSIAFSRPVSVNIWVKITLAYDRALYPSDGDTQVIDKTEARQDAQRVGKNVVASNIAAGVFLDVPGILDVSEVLIGTSNPPTASATINITPRQKANFDTSRISVVAAPGSF
jgi:uncharacterized phage protein gp47/JayE